MDTPTIAECHAEFHGRLSALGPVVVAGGSVRDELLGRRPKDFDVFVLGVPWSKDTSEAAADTVSDLIGVEQLEVHKSEPFLAASVEWRGVVVQVMCSPHRTTADLLDSFDWHVSRFAFDGQTHALTPIESIAPGKALQLHRVTFPLSTLRRGFRFAERFGMEFRREDIETLCREVARQADIKRTAREEGAA